MDQRLVLHTLLRQYCITRRDECDSLYRRFILDGSRKEPDLDRFNALVESSEGHRRIVRVQAVEAILRAVERHTFESAQTPDGLAADVEASASASAVWREEFITESVVLEALAEERRSFANYLNSLRVNLPRRVDPLPFRRTLQEQETAALWDALNQRWDTTHGYWHPRTGLAIPTDVWVFNETFAESGGSDTIRTILRNRSVARIFELDRFDERPCEIDADVLEIRYEIPELYWTAQPFDWICYASHEGTVAIGGDWMLSALRQSCPEVDEHRIA
ncbi:MAG: hypothetical protein ABI823_12845 [Bryobacteraceae bacterium]